MIALGWDPGILTCGYGVLELLPASSRVLAFGDIGQPSDTRDEARLDVIADAIDHLMNRWCPDIVGYENQATVHVGKDREGQQASWKLKRVHEVTGMMRLAARCSLAEAVPCYTPAAVTIKVTVLGKGNGHAEKSQIVHGVKRLFGVKCTSHEADAIGAALASVRQHRHAEAVRRRSAALKPSRPSPDLLRAR